MRRASIFAIINLAICITSVKPDAASEQQLRHELFTNRKLDPECQPEPYDNDTINVKIDCYAIMLHKLDVRKNILKMTIWLRMEWVNQDLAWYTTEFGGIEAIHVHPRLIWIPRLTLLNSAIKMDENVLHSTLAVVRNTGQIVLITPLTTESHCVVDIQRFPFDRHVCTLIFGSWTHDGSHINITAVFTGTVAGGEPILANNFKLIQMSGRTILYRHTFCREIYSVGLIEYEFERQYEKYQVGILLPAALICLLTAGTFWVPPLTGNRLKMGLILLLANLLLLINLGLTLPISSSSTPSIIIFCVHSLCFVTISLILSMVAINLSAKCCSEASPECIKSLRNGWLLKCLFIDIGENDDEEDEKEFNGWLTVVAIMDRISFLVFCVSFLLLFILYLH